MGLVRGRLDPWQGTIDPKASSPNLTGDAPEPHPTPAKGRERGEQGGKGTEREDEAPVGGRGAGLGPQPPLAAASGGSDGSGRQVQEFGVERRWRSLVAPETPRAERGEGLHVKLHILVSHLQITDVSRRS
jgi:hypothetical protein